MNLKQAFIDNNSIRLGLSADTWQEAVQLAVQPLIDSGAVTSAYYDAIIASTEKYGPYYVLMPGWQCLTQKQVEGSTVMPFL